tara:strand:+ start:169 stop:480 length:312 start_codon:yes stop_codon:yes gene_type:complete
MCNVLLTKKKLTRLFLFSLISSSFITPVLANDNYWFGFSWGGMYGACSAYKYNEMSKKDAKSQVASFLNLGKENINDREIYTELKNLQTKSPFIDDCKSLISY